MLLDNLDNKLERLLAILLRIAKALEGDKHIDPKVNIDLLSAALDHDQRIARKLDSYDAEIYEVIRNAGQAYLELLENSNE